MIKPFGLLSLVSLSALVVNCLAANGAAASSPKIEESYYVFDASPSILRPLQQSGSIVIDHVSRQGFEAYGPAGTGEYLSGLNLHFIEMGAQKDLIAGNYPTYEQNTAKLQDLARRFPRIAQLTSIGKSTEGRELWVMKISDNAAVDQVKPEVKLISSMHGNEITGREVMMRLIEEILSQYGKNPEITRLVDTTEIFLMPSMNPDGSQRQTRANASGADLNRSFPDFSTSDNQNTPVGRPVEVQAVMNWQAQRHFSLSANYHGGTFVVNYPWDTVADAHPLDSLVRTLSLEYAAKVPDFANSPEFQGGVTNGYAWYEVNGGMQDWSYYWYNDLQLTIEISAIKWPDYADIPGYWAANRDAMIQFLSRVHQGAGFVLKEARNASGKVAITKLAVNGSAGASLGTYGFTGGEFYKVLEAGKYRFDVQAGSIRQSVTLDVNDDLSRAMGASHFAEIGGSIR